MKPEAVKAYAGPIEDHPIYMGYEVALGYALRPTHDRHRTTIELYILTGVAYREISFYDNYLNTVSPKIYCTSQDQYLVAYGLARTAQAMYPIKPALRTPIISVQESVSAKQKTYGHD